MTQLSNNSILSTFCPTKSYYGDFLYVDNLFSCPVPLAGLSATYDHKREQKISGCQWDFTGMQEFYSDSWNDTAIQGSMTPTYNDVTNTFFTRNTMTNYYNTFIVEAPIQAGEGKITFDKLLSGLTVTSRDPERYWFAYADSKRGTSYYSDIYAIAAYGRFDDNGQPLYPSGIEINPIYRHIDLRLRFSGNSWKIQKRHIAPFLNSCSNWNYSASHTPMSGFLNIGSAQRATAYWVEKLGDYQSFYAAESDAGNPQNFNVYKNCDVISSATEIDWNYASTNNSYVWASYLDNCNDGEVMQWSNRFKNNRWEQNIDKVLNFGGNDSGWTVEVAHFVSGNISSFIDFRTAAELSKSFLGNQIDILDFRTEYQYGGEDYSQRATVIFKNGSLLEGFWKESEHGTSGFII